MKIIKYKKIKSNQYEVVLEDNSKIELYEDVIIQEELLLKKEIVNLDELLEINKKYAIYDQALKYLNRHIVSVYEMKKYLLKKNYSEEIINDILDKLIQKGYLNDSYYAKCYINDKINLTNDGPLKIKKHLEDNNIPSNVYEILLNSYQNIWSERINAYLQKQLKINKKSSHYFKSKMMINLINLGYEKEMINDVLNNIQFANEDNLKKLEEAKIRNKLERKYSGVELEYKIKEKLYQKGFFE